MGPQETHYSHHCWHFPSHPSLPQPAWPPVLGFQAQLGCDWLALSVTAGATLSQWGVRGWASAWPFQTVGARQPGPAPGSSSQAGPCAAQGSQPRTATLVPSEKSSFRMQSSGAKEKGIKKPGPLSGIITYNNKTYPPQIKHSIKIGLMEDSGFRSGF